MYRKWYIKLRSTVRLSVRALLTKVNNALMKIWKLTFEIVDPREHSEYYCEHGSHPATDPATIPDEHWTPVERLITKEEDVAALADQYLNLIDQASEGELVRNPRFFTATINPHWAEIVDVLRPEA